MGCSQTKCRLCVIFFSSSLHHFRRYRHPLLLSCTLSFRGLVYSSVLAPTLKLEKAVDCSVSSCRLASFDIQRSGDIDANTIIAFSFSIKRRSVQRDGHVACSTGSMVCLTCRDKFTDKIEAVWARFPGGEAVACTGLMLRWDKPVHPTRLKPA